MKEKGIVQNISIIVIILAIIFLSQQSFFNKNVKDFYNKATAQVGPHWTNAENWLKGNIYPKIGDTYSNVSSGALNRGEDIKDGLTLQKEKVSENFGEKIKNYFSGIVDSVFNPSKKVETQNCQQTCPAVK